MPASFSWEVVSPAAPATWTPESPMGRKEAMPGAKDPTLAYTNCSSGT